MAAPEKIEQSPPAIVPEGQGLVVPFQMPAMVRPILAQGRTAQQRRLSPQQHQPQFVVFELSEEPIGASALAGIGHLLTDQLTLSNNMVADNRHQQQLNSTPFQPLGNHRNINSQNEGEKGQQLQQQEKAPLSATADVCFTTVQLGPTSHPMNVRGGHRATTPFGRNRLLFDNPMFRRLPNWHFFGDDRFLVPIPPMIPLISVPVERTLLYIAPNESSTRQLLLFAMLDMKRRGLALPENERREEDVPAEPTTRSNSSEPDEEDGTLLLPAESHSTSGVDSMSSEETATTPSAMTPADGGSTPDRLRTPTPPADEAKLAGGAEAKADGQQIAESSTTTSSASVTDSSAPNSPPTFDRRIVRMSRGTRDAVRRLSRRADEEEYDEGEVNGEGNDDDEEAEWPDELTANTVIAVPLANPAPTSTISMMSTAGHAPISPQIYRNRHTSAGNNCSRSKRPQPSSVSDDAISRMDVLSERIYNFHQNEEQTESELNRKLHLRDQLYYAISPSFPLCGLYIVGSSLNGFGTNRSDLDLCLMITNRDIDQKSDAVLILSTVKRTLESNKMVVDQKLILAKVPILRIKCDRPYSDIMVDLNVNNSVAIRNTHLMCYYSFFDWRVRPLVMIVKEWAKRRGINNASRSSFTSYSLVLMVIHYLQCGANPPVLPNLQEMYVRRFSSRADVRTLNVSLPLDPIPTAIGWKYSEDMALSELLLGFLHYYAVQFNFDVDAISIRMGTKVDRAQVAQNQSPFNTLSQWHCICIEEPFTLTNAAHSIFDDRIFQDIKKAFLDSYNELNKYRDLDRFLGPPKPLPSSSADPTDIISPNQQSYTALN